MQSLANRLVGNSSSCTPLETHLQCYKKILEKHEIDRCKELRSDLVGDTGEADLVSMIEQNVNVLLRNKDVSKLRPENIEKLNECALDLLKKQDRLRWVS